MYIKWLAHAAFQIKTEEKTIYIDPRYMKKFANQVGSFFENPEKADLILLTHHHTDHCYPATLEQIRTSDTSIVAPGLCRRKIAGEFTAIEPGEEIMIDDVQIRAVDAYNIKRCRTPGRPWHPKGDGVGYLVTLEGKTIYHAGDTESIPEMQQLGHVDVALPPIGQKFTMGIDEAIEAAMAISPGIVMPMHIHETDPEEFKTKLESRSNIKVVLLEPDEAYRIE